MSVNSPNTRWPRNVIVAGGLTGTQQARVISNPELHFVLLGKNNDQFFCPLLYPVARVAIQTDFIANSFHDIYKKIRIILSFPWQRR